MFLIFLMGIDDFLKFLVLIGSVLGFIFYILTSRLKIENHC